MLGRIESFHNHHRRRRLVAVFLAVFVLAAVVLASLTTGGPNENLEQFGSSSGSVLISDDRQRCNVERVVVTHLPREMRAEHLVGLWRMCELASLVYGLSEYSLRLYTPRRLSVLEKMVLAIRCRLCVEEWVVDAATEPWKAKLHAVLSPDISVGLMRSIYWRATKREKQTVQALLREGGDFHVIRDHPVLHGNEETVPPHTWGFKRGRQRQCFDKALAECGSAAGEESFLACAWKLCMANTAAVASWKTMPPRCGLEYVGRMAGAREEDLQGGWKHFVLAVASHKSDHPILQCLAPVAVPEMVVLGDGERRFLSFCVYGNRKGDQRTLWDLIIMLRSREKRMYTNWNMVLFVDADVDVEFLRELGQLAKDGDFSLFVFRVTTELSGCEHLKEDKMMWRNLFPVYLPMIDRFVVRDADSMIQPREWSAVQEWINSGQNLHFMYDSRYHGERIMGGMWGSVSKTHMHVADVYKQMVETYYYHNDQWFLVRSCFVRGLSDCF